MQSIRRRILIPICLVILAIMVTLYGFNLHQARSRLQAQSEARYLALVGEISNEVDGWLMQKTQKVETLARSTATIDFLKQDEQTGLAYWKSVREIQRIRNNDPDICLLYTQSSRYAQLYSENDSSHPDEPYTPVGRIWYELPLIEGHTVWTPPYIGDADCPSEAGKPIASVVTPVHDENGRVLGLVGADMLLTVVQNLVNKNKPAEAAFIFIVDAQGKFILHPDPPMNLKTDLFTINNGKYRGLAERMTGRTSGFVRTSLFGQEGYLFYSPTKSGPWSIGVMIPTDVIDGAATSLLWASILGVLLALLLVFFAVDYVAHSISSPLSSLVAAAESIASGNLGEFEFKRTRIYEISVLNEAFRTMAQRLRILLKELTDVSKEVSIREAQFRKITDNMRDLICQTDTKGIFEYASPSHKSVVGYDPEELIGRCAFDFIHPDDMELTLKKYKEALVTSMPPRMEYRFRHMDGSYVWLETTGSPIMEEGVMIGAIISSRNITERRRAEDALAAEKERLTVTLRSIGDGVVAVDSNGKVALINEVAEQLTGWNQQDAVGENVRRVFDTDPPYDYYWEGYFSRGDEAIFHFMPGDLLLISKKGDELVIDASCAPIKDSQGTNIGVVIVFRDVTQRRRMEEELLMTSKLESLGVLAGGIAHDFNNLLTIIVGNIMLARNNFDDPRKFSELLAESEKACFQAKSFTHQLLTFSCGGVMVKRITAIDTLVKDSVLFASSGSNVKCDFYINDDIWPVEADEGQISQVINNFIINAIQAMPQGGTVSIRIINVVFDDAVIPLASGPYVMISIKDQGPGIPEDIQAKIFDPFFTTKSGGHGLGLATSFSIIRNHGGYIELASHKEPGAAFNIYLPAHPGAVPPAKEPHRSDLGCGNERVLLMDDDDKVREVIAQMLTLLGCEVIEARNGDEALELYRKALNTDRKISLVIMDLTVPGGMGGTETMQRLRQIDPGVIGIVSSGYSDERILGDYESWGFQAALAKPYGTEELCRTIRFVLHREITH